MKKQSLISIFGVVLIFVMGLSAPALANPDQRILVTPLELEFGEVEVGTTSPLEILIKNINGHFLFVQSVDFANGSSQDFSVVTNPSVPIRLSSGNEVTATVTFSPSSAGEHIASLVVINDDPESPYIEVLISGIGKGELTIDDVLDFFDASIDAGTLEGRGRGWLAKLRLCIMREMLVIAGEFIERDRINAACYMLQRAYNRCDGQRRPYDFIIGESVPELTNMISNLMCSLDCKGCPKIYSAILNYYKDDQDGDGQEEDWIEIKLMDEYGNPISAVKYEIIYPDGTIKEGTLDENGTAKESLTSFGPIDINFPDLSPGSWKKI